MLFLPDTPRHHVCDQWFQLLAFLLSGHRSAEQMRPFRPGFCVIHDQAAHPEFPGDLERQFLAVKFTDVHDAVVTKVSPRGRDDSIA